jgi:hypothetical protein
VAIWKQVVGFEGLYEVSSGGKVRRPLDYVPVWPVIFMRLTQCEISELFGVCRATVSRVQKGKCWKAV